MAQARGANQNGRRSDPTRAAYGRIHDRAYLGTGGPNGRQVFGSFQRPGASAPRTGSSLKQPQKHAARRPGENNVLEIIITTPARASRANQPPTLTAAFKRASVQAHKHQSASKRARIADQSSSAQARERTSESPDSLTAELS